MGRSDSAARRRETTGSWAAPGKSSGTAPFFSRLRRSVPKAMPRDPGEGSTARTTNTGEITNSRTTREKGDNTDGQQTKREAHDSRSRRAKKSQKTTSRKPEATKPEKKNCQPRELSRW